MKRDDVERTIQGLLAACKELLAESGKQRAGDWEIINSGMVQGEQMLRDLRTEKAKSPASERAKTAIVEYLIEWLEVAEEAGHNTAPPVSLGSVIEDDITLRDLIEMARGRKR